MERTRQDDQTPRTHGDTRGSGPVRSTQREGRVRRRLRLQHRRASLARDRRARHRGAEEPAAPRRGGRRREHGRRRGHPVQIPDRFFCASVRPRSVSALPAAGRYGVGDDVPARRRRAPGGLPGSRRAGRRRGGAARSRAGARCRPTTTVLGEAARATRPSVWQCFVDGGGPARTTALERKLYVVRRQCEKRGRGRRTRAPDSGVLRAQPLLPHDRLQGPDDGHPGAGLLRGPAATRASRARWPWCTSATAPTRSPPGSWPSRSATWRTTARSTPCAATSTGCGRASAASSPTCSATTSRSSCRSSTRAAATRPASTTRWSCCRTAGRDLHHAMMMLIPQAWGAKYPMGPDLRGFFEYHAGLMEPWDGPAAVAFTDGRMRRRAARPQRAAARALHHHQGRLHGLRLRGRRARHPAGRRCARRARCGPGR